MITGPGGVATIALLVARGCADHHLEHAYQWLERQRIPDTVAQLVADCDQAIAVARAMDPDR